MPLTGDAKRNYENARARETHESVREIGAPPPIVDPARREACKHDLRRYLLTYHPFAFPLEFGQEHERLIQMTQEVLLDGGQVIAAFPRGSGKTTIFMHAEIWATLYGHRRFPMLIAAEDKKFRSLLAGIKKVLENNDLLLADFPEVVHPIRSLERISLRANYQLCEGKPTHMRWGTDQIVYPMTRWTVERGNASMVIGGGGITSAAVRGAVVTTPGGDLVRPDAALIDDPQTRKSAKSQSQCQEREDLINADILGMAGPGKRIAAMCAVTVIYQTDLADRLLDKERSPAWQSIRVPMIQSWPSDMGIWGRYDTIRRQEQHDELEAGSANAFYEQHREAMDRGAKVYWEARVEPGCLSALQSAMNDYFANPRAFMAEKQNQPESQVDGDLAALNPLVLVRRVTTHKRGDVPAECTHLTAHIDVQARILYWMVCGWTQQFGGYVIDYGTTPKQRRAYFTLTDLRTDLVDLSKAYPGNDDAGALKAAIKETTEALSARKWLRADGAEMQIERGLVDSRWMTETVEAALVISKAKQWMPSFGVGIRAKDAPIANWTKKRGIRRGHNWVVQKPDRRLFLACFYDTNYWKTETHAALMVPPTHTQSTVFFKDTPTGHQLLADHVCAEHATRVEARGRIVDEWELPSSKHDNHWWDTLVGCRVAASLCGIQKGTETNVKRKPNKPAGQRVRKLAV
jgi:hypothetical protein